MGKRKHSASSETKRTRNPYILDDVEEVDEDYESDYDEGESVGDSVEAPAKQKKKTSGKSAKRTSGAGKSVSKELAAAIKETERREKDRQKRQVNIFATMTTEELVAYARDHYGDMTVAGEEEDGEDEAVLGSDDDDYSDDENDTSYERVYDLADRGFNLWMVRCAKRRERANVRKIKRRIRELKKKGTHLPIGGVPFFHKAITGLFWVEAKNRKDLMEALKDCQVLCAEKNVKMVPSDELGATYCLRPRAIEVSDDLVQDIGIGKNVCITQKGEFLGLEGMIVDLEQDSVTVIFPPDIQPKNFSRNGVKVQEQDG